MILIEVIKIMSDREPWKKSCNDCKSVESKYACPVYNCSKHGDEEIRWKHSGCGYLRLYSNGKEKCERCGKEEYFCLWDCSCYDASKNEKEYNYTKILNIIQKLVGIDTRSVGVSFLWDLRMSIEKQFEMYPERFHDD